MKLTYTIILCYILSLHMYIYPTDKASSKLGYLSFSVLPTHISDTQKIATLSHTLSTFRTYIQYHIKSSKTYFHMRMRQRVNSMLQVLNRAKQDTDENANLQKKEKKTISGKTFQRQ